ncbi:MAG: site-specific integrase [Gammaproteobacteria bacterium]|nr:site-specific integrase [Gammaproteobacteria bacterium]
MAKENLSHERTLFIMNALYAMYLRISELAATSHWTPQMGHFYRDNDGLWWFKTRGKGNKERHIAVSADMLDALKRFRKHLKLTSLPSPGETTPLISKKTGIGPMTSTRPIRTLVQECFNRSAIRLKEDGFKEDSQQLMNATVHWLRHTGISDDVKTRPREHVRDDAGHSNSSITDKYIDVDLRDRNDTAKKKKIVPAGFDEAENK